MKTEDLGEVFFEGKIIELDSLSIQESDNILSQLKTKEENIMNRLNNVLAEIQ